MRTLTLSEMLYILFGAAILKYAHYSLEVEQISIRASEISKVESPLLFYFTFALVCVVGLFLVIVPFISDRAYDKLTGQDENQ